MKPQPAPRVIFFGALYVYVYWKTWAIASGYVDYKVRLPRPDLVVAPLEHVLVQSVRRFLQKGDSVFVSTVGRHFKDLQWILLQTSWATSLHPLSSHRYRKRPICRCFTCYIYDHFPYTNYQKLCRLSFLFISIPTFMVNPESTPYNWYYWYMMIYDY